MKEMRASLSWFLFFLIIICVVTVGYSFFSLTNNSTRSYSQLPLSIPKDIPIISPSLTAVKSDLSYITIYGGENSKLTLFDSEGREISRGFFQAPISSSQTGETAGEGMMMLYYVKPNDGEYTLQVETLDAFVLQIILYDKNGNLNSRYFPERYSDKTSEFKILFNKKDSKLSTISRITP